MKGKIIMHTKLITKNNFLISGLILILTGLYCSESLPEVQEVQVIPEGFELYVDEKEGFSLLKPSDWKTENRYNDQSKQNFFVLTSPAEVAGNESNVSVIVSDSTDKSIGQYTNDLLTSYIQLFQSFDLENRDTLTINDVLFGTFTLKYDLEDRTYRMNTVYTIHKKILYQINAVSPAENYANDKDVMDIIIESFVILRK